MEWYRKLDGWRLADGSWLAKYWVSPDRFGNQEDLLAIVRNDPPWGSDEPEVYRIDFIDEEEAKAHPHAPYVPRLILIYSRELEKIRQGVRWFLPKNVER